MDPKILRIFLKILAKANDINEKQNGKIDVNNNENGNDLQKKKINENSDEFIDSCKQNLIDSLKQQLKIYRGQ